MLTRRDLLRMGAIGSAVALTPRFATRGWAQSSTTNTVGISSYATQPWLDELRTYYDATSRTQYIANVPVKTPKATGIDCEDALTPGTMAGPFIEHVPYEGERTKLGTYHQRWNQFRPQSAYEIRVRKTTHQFHKSLKPTTIFGYDGIFPAPLFKARYGEPNLVRFYNELPPDHVGFGSPDISTHLHNAHNASESDGGPWNFFPPGTCWDNHYPNVLAGFSTDPAGKGDPNEALGTLWFHDHRQDFTAQNVYAGLAGFYLLYDDLDCDDETNPNGLKLPSGNYDVPLIFADKVIGPDYNLKYDFFSMDGILGDKYTVNGKIQPFMKVERRKYRFRLLNGGPSRVYSFGLSNRAPMWLIANDGNLLPQAIKRGQPTNPGDVNQYLLMGVAERMDIIIDFSQYAPGTVIYLNNYCEQINGAGPTGKVLSTPVPMLKFVVGTSPAVADQSIIPDAAGLARIGRSTMRDLPTVDTTDAEYRQWDFGRSNGAWTVNNMIFDANVCSAEVRRGSKQVWTFRSGGGWWHPVHVHMEEHQILSRKLSTSVPYTYPYEGRKDVTLLRGAENTDVFFRFRDWLGKYPMHCHNVVHEDHAMMVRFDLVDPDAKKTETT